MFSRNYLFASFFFLAGCASVVEVEDMGSRQEGDWQGVETSPTILVVGYAYDPAIRLDFEQSMVEALRSIAFLRKLRLAECRIYVRSTVLC
ncbi:MAG: hypothetical protein ACON39_03190 [Coraliomargaritaceae bacterium]